ncbi:MAG: hypothetical protein V1704_01510 [Candidatus Vogelbacteria bacterium]
MASIEQEVDLVQVTALDLGLHMKVKEGDDLYGLALRMETNQRATAQGLQLCPTEVAPQLRLQGDENDYCMIATEKLPFCADDGEGYATLGLGIMGSKGGQKATLAAYAEDWTLPNLKWVFVKPRKQERQ